MGQKIAKNWRTPNHLKHVYGMLLLELERRDGARMRQDLQLVTWPLHFQSVLTLPSFPGRTVNRVLLDRSRSPDAEGINDPLP